MPAMSELLGGLFANAEAIMDELSAEKGQFNSQQFLRRVMRDRQAAYIDILMYFRDNPEPFHRAHVEIGEQLSHVAQQHGYTQMPGHVPETSIFLTPTTATAYRRS